MGVTVVGVISMDTSSRAIIPAGVGFVVYARYDTDAFVGQLSETILEALIQVNKEEANTTTYRGAYVRLWSYWVKRRCEVEV
jgi:hypothetical protein